MRNTEGKKEITREEKRGEVVRSITLYYSHSFYIYPFLYLYQPLPSFLFPPFLPNLITFPRNPDIYLTLHFPSRPNLFSFPTSQPLYPLYMHNIPCSISLPQSFFLCLLLYTSVSHFLIALSLSHSLSLFFLFLELYTYPQAVPNFLLYGCT